MLLSSYISPKARKGTASTIEGRGLVATAPIAREEIVAIKGGHIVDTATLRSLPERLANSGEVECRCGTPSCRGTIGGRDWRCPELQRRYGSYLSWHLMRRLGSLPGNPG
jgi:hypothetical protein